MLATCDDAQASCEKAYSVVAGANAPIWDARHMNGDLLVADGLTKQLL